MSNEPTTKVLPVKEALTTDSIYEQEQLDILLDVLEKQGRYDTAAKIIDRQIGNSASKEQAAISRSHHLPGMLAYGNRQIIESEAALNTLLQKQAKLKAEQETVQAAIMQESCRRSLLQSRLQRYAHFIGS